MGKIIDKVGVSLILLLLSFLLFFRWTGSWIVAGISALLLVLTVAILLHLIRPRSTGDRLSKKNFIRYILLHGNERLKSLVEKSFDEKYDLSSEGDHTLLSLNGERILIYYAYKFGSLSEEDVAKSFRIATRVGCDCIYALTNHLDRKALAVTEYVPQKFNVISATRLYNYLSRKMLVPKKDALQKRSGKAFNILKILLKSDNAKYYVWAGLTTALLALFTPITAYYIVFSFINLILAICTIALGERSEGEGGLFKE